MSELVKILLSLSLSGTLLIFILLLCKPLYKNRLSRQWQYYIWLVVVARLLLPLTPEVSLVGSLFQSIDTAIVQIGITGQQELNSPILPNIDPIEQAPLENRVSAITNKSTKFQKSFLQNVWLICGFVWLIGVIGLLIRKITVYQSFVKYIKAGCVEVSDMRLWEVLGKLVEQVGIKTTVGLYTNALISSPLLIGFFHPCIILPSADLSNSDLENTILHELTHYKCRDMFYKWLVQITICLHWFNPFVHFMGKEIGCACEFSCDEVTIRKLDFTQQQAYGDTLLNAIKIGGSYNDSIMSVTLGENAKQIKERLDAIMAFKEKTRLCIAISIVLVFVLSFGATVAGAYTITPSINTINLNNARNPSNQSIWDLGQVTRWNISVESENVIVKSGGTSFQIEVTPESKSSYILEDYMHVITDDFQEREIALKRKEGLGDGAVYSPTIIITVPNQTLNVLNVITTTSGNISIDNSHADKILAESETGAIKITNSVATDYIIAESLAGTVTLTNTTCDGEIYIQDKNSNESETNGNAHLSQSGYSKDEFSKLLKVAESYANKVAKKEHIGIAHYVGELFDLEVVKGMITFTFDLENSKYTTLVVNVNSDGKVVGYDYWNSPD